VRATSAESLVLLLILILISIFYRYEHVLVNHNNEKRPSLKNVQLNRSVPPVKAMSSLPPSASHLAETLKPIQANTHSYANSRRPRLDANSSCIELGYEEPCHTTRRSDRERGPDLSSSRFPASASSDPQFTSRNFFRSHDDIRTPRSYKTAATAGSSLAPPPHQSHQPRQKDRRVVTRDDLVSALPTDTGHGVDSTTRRHRSRRHSVEETPLTIKVASIGPTQNRDQDRRYSAQATRPFLLPSDRERPSSYSSRRHSSTRTGPPISTHQQKHFDNRRPDSPHPLRKHTMTHPEPRQSRHSPSHSKHQQLRRQPPFIAQRTRSDKQRNEKVRTSGHASVVVEEWDTRQLRVK
jgi:hypothetical protein